MSTQSQLKDSYQQQRGYLTGLQPQFGNVAGYGSNPNNVKSGSMFSPDWYYNAVNQSQGGLNDAQTQQQAGSGSADQYGQFAAGAGDQMAPGQQAQQTDVDRQQFRTDQLNDAASKSQGQADWLWQNPGYTDQEKNAMMTSSATPIAGSFSSAQQDLSNQAARTGNSAAYGAQAGDLARQKAMALSQNALQQQGQFAGARVQGQQFATEAQGAATGARAQTAQAQQGVSQAQDASNARQQAGMSLQGNLMQGAVNNRIGLAGSNIQRGEAGTSQMGANQSGFATSMMPYQLASQNFNNTNSAIGQNTSNQGQNAAANPGWGKTFQGALGAGLAGGMSAVGGMYGKKLPGAPQ